MAASAVPTESPVESTKEYDDIQKMFLAIDKDTTEDDLLKLIEEYEVAYTAEDYNGTPKKRCYNIAFEEGAALQRYADSGDTLEVSFDQNDGTVLYAEYFNDEAFMDDSFIIIMVRIGILVKMSRVMCIRDIITISQEIQKVALL